VELLVVIAIIAILAALVTPAVMQAQVAARNAAIKVEIDMLHMAMMQYKNEYGSFPPCTATFSVSGTDTASRHVKRVFPRIDGGGLLTQLQSLPYRNTGSGTFPAASGVTPDTALVAWMYGYNGDSSYPVLLTNGSISIAGSTATVSGTVTPRIKTYDFDTSRISTSFRYAPSGKANSPYIYLLTGTTGYGTIVSGSSNLPWIIGSGTYRAQVKPNGTEFFNSDTFQILCAGRDEEWNTADDLSNFWPRTRGEYKDSLNQ